MKEKAIEYYQTGCTCSESIIRAAIDEGLCDKSYLGAAMAFSGGMGNGCLCGTVAASQMIIGATSGNEARITAKEFLDEFKSHHKVACCRVLSAGLEGMEKRKHCINFVSECAQMLDERIKSKKFN